MADSGLAGDNGAANGHWPQPDARAPAPLRSAAPAWANGSTAAPRDESGRSPRFLARSATATDPGRASQLAAARAALRNVFTPARPVTDRRSFAGREGVQIRLISAIEDQQSHAVIYGERGIGKTSLLNMLGQAAGEAGYRVVYFPAGASSSFEELFRAIAAKIPVAFHADYGPRSEQGEQGLSLADVMDQEPITVSRAANLLAGLSGVEVLALVDEFDRSRDARFRQDLAEFLKTLSDRSISLQMVIAGVAGDLIELVGPDPVTQRNIVAVELGRMTTPEMHALIDQGGRVAGLRFATEAAHAIALAAGGLPHIASLLANRSALLALGEGRTEISPDDVAAARSDALENLRERVSRDMQARIARCQRQVSRDALRATAGAALARGGAFGRDDVVADDLERQGPGRSDPIEILLTEGVIAQGRDESARSPRLRFVEEAAAGYLNFLVADATVRPSPEPAGSVGVRDGQGQQAP